MKPVIAVPATLALVYRAWSHRSLTPAGILAAAITAAAHAYHPWNLPFALLCIFFLAGTRVTKIKKDVKASLTVPSKGTSGGEGPRTHVQVFANSIVATILSLFHATLLRERKSESVPADPSHACYPWGGDLLVVGIIANYAAVAADTFSSELGILSKSHPRLITSPTLRKVPPGTNGGVTLTGTLAGLLGSTIIVASSMLFLPMCGPGGDWEWSWERRAVFFVGLSLWGALGSLLDSILGGLFQRTVRDSRSGKIVEGEGGVRVLVESGSTRELRAAVQGAASSGDDGQAVEDTDETHGELVKGKRDAGAKQRKPSFGDGRPSRVVESGWNLLDNNDVNVLMAFSMSLGAMAVAGYLWEVPMSSVLAR